MRLRDVKIEDVSAGTNWRLKDSRPERMVDWEVEQSSEFGPTDSVVYSGVTVYANGEVRPILLVKEVGDPGWWGDTLEFLHGSWRQVGLELRTVGERPVQSESYIAAPLPQDPSFMGEYCHANQRAGFERFRARLKQRANFGLS
jgi:hypothetical protein